MKKILSCSQIREIDKYTILNEPVLSIDLMERAASKLFEWITERYTRTALFRIFAGPGNNGGDALALSRIMISERYNVETYFIRISANPSEECRTNLLRLEEAEKGSVHIIDSADGFPALSSDDIIIDGIFGCGISRPVDGLASHLIQYINSSDVEVISIDLPSGLFAEDNSSNKCDSIIVADFTLTFQIPKLSLLLADNNQYVGDLYLLDIGLDMRGAKDLYADFYLLEESDIISRLKTIRKFDHKGTNGHGLLISGSWGKMGSAVLGAASALRTGLGLLTAYVPACGINVLQGAIPEAMVISDDNNSHISDITDLKNYSAIAVGPGIGMHNETVESLQRLLNKCDKPMVIDADALNILSENKNWYSMLPENSILTPHVKEFERLAGKSDNCYQRMQNQIGFSKKHRCLVILKGAHTSISSPDGTVLFNSTGNPGMATAGSGDVLTGILLSLLAQGYSAESAAILGVYIHGLAGDLALRGSGYEAIIASDIVKNIGSAFNRLRSVKYKV